VGGLQHLVRNGITGFTIPHNDPIALEEKLTQLVCQDELREQMKKNSVEYAQTFSWDVITPKIISVYKEALN